MYVFFRVFLFEHGIFTQRQYSTYAKTYSHTHRTNITISRLITTAHVQIWEYCECELFIESEYSVPSYSICDIISNPVYSFVGRTKVSDTHTQGIKYHWLCMVLKIPNWLNINPQLVLRVWSLWARAAAAAADDDKHICVVIEICLHKECALHKTQSNSSIEAFTSHKIHFTGGKILLHLDYYLSVQSQPSNQFRIPINWNSSTGFHLIKELVHHMLEYLLETKSLKAGEYVCGKSLGMMGNIHSVLSAI